LKIRFGVGLGAGTGPDELPGLVDRLEANGVDSLWLSELVYSDAVDPFVGMAYALARTGHLKVGTSVAVLPGRHPVLVAKQLASLAALAPGRVLPVFGLRSAIPAEREIFVVPAGERAAVFDESLQLLRSVLENENAAFSGRYFEVASAAVRPRPVKPLDIWLGGSAPAAFRRIGRLGDGWLGSFLTPAEARRVRALIQSAAADAGREIEPDHFGASLNSCRGRPIPEPVSAGHVVHDLAGVRGRVVRRGLGQQPCPEVGQLDDELSSAAAGLHRVIDKSGDLARAVGFGVGRPAGAGVAPDRRGQHLARVIAFVNRIGHVGGLPWFAAVVRFSDTAAGVC